MIPPARALAWTVLGVIVAVSSADPTIKLSFAVSIVALTAVSIKHWRSVKSFGAVSLPLLVPLLLIHSLVNPQFEIDGKIWVVPLRTQGFVFAIAVYSNLAVFLAIAIAWWQVNRDEFFDWMVARRVPVLLVGLVAQSMAMVTLIEKRGRAVFKAQTARGIPTGPNWRYRFRALPSVVLPVVTSLINEADQRSTVLWSRGFLQHNFAATKVPFGEVSECGWAVASIIMPMVMLLL
jgi:energy-coupling factor transport system permease protein